MKSRCFLFYCVICVSSLEAKDIFDKVPHATTDKRKNACNATDPREDFAQYASSISVFNYDGKGQFFLHIFFCAWIFHLKTCDEGARLIGCSIGVFVRYMSTCGAKNASTMRYRFDCL